MPEEKESSREASLTMPRPNPTSPGGNQDAGSCTFPSKDSSPAVSDTEEGHKSSQSSMTSAERHEQVGLFSACQI